MKIIPDGDPNRQNKPAVVVRIRAINAGRVRQYFAGLESLAREVRSTRDPLVIRTALAMMATQQDTVDELLEGA